MVRAAPYRGAGKRKLGRCATATTAAPVWWLAEVIRTRELARGASIPPPQKTRARPRHCLVPLPPTLSAGKYGFLDQDGLEDRSSGVGIDHGASAHVIGFAKVLELADVTGDAESSSSLTS